MGKQILLVEDDRLSRESLSSLLRGLGHEVNALPSAEDAKTALKTFQPDVALLDVRLPGLSGDAFAVYLRHKHLGVKIVLISGEFRVDDLARIGPNVAFIPKPLDVEKLLHTIQA